MLPHLPAREQRHREPSFERKGGAFGFRRPRDAVWRRPEESGRRRRVGREHVQGTHSTVGEGKAARGGAGGWGWEGRGRSQACAWGGGAGGQAGREGEGQTANGGAAGALCLFLFMRPFRHFYKTLEQIYSVASPLVFTFPLSLRFDWSTAQSEFPSSKVGRSFFFFPKKVSSM
jgi:hypothetical protein